MYYKGGVNKERAIYGANIEQIQEDAVKNAASIESQITRLNRATEALRKQQKAVEEAINANQEVNLNVACSTSDHELREFNEAVRAANRGLPTSSHEQVP